MLSIITSQAFGKHNDVSSMDVDQFKIQLELYLFTHKISPSAFSKKIGIGQSTISRILNGEIKNNFKQKTKERFSEFFKVPFNLIEANPSVINNGKLPSCFETRINIGKAVHTIPVFSFSEYLPKKKIIDELLVTLDISEECFALMVEDNDFAPIICVADIIVINPCIFNDYDNLDGKNVVLKENDVLTIKKARYIEDTLLLKGKSMEIYDEKRHTLLGWITEIRRRS